MLSHSKTHHKMVRHILREIAAKTHTPYPGIKKLFVVDCDIDISLRFWDLLREHYQKHTFTDVFHCPECEKFELE